ncbi:TPA: cytochrome c biogenesis heme-transporting ATPase CcmA [Pasteurella multocida]|uniref:Cytochrome c biogenesis heme-transporting ATPase CcmA n=1 Tax=Pasteurella multocida TaxID=747 RepID=A0A9X3UQY8_PASMD|nr:cytochrome c biogenesis heme-transporting ATPase CcmA [Pasteurella multocida]AWW60131.1 cytochrome c biogenesis heme-transporting ATPase CcmA [Pasteurellaceae bacterium 12591]EGP02727.1 cytochrome c biogenesis protein CcmA [Pasteurella multocida subsp. gallicida str. Anand1_poultry]AET16204.1 heme ABC exporter ATP-binding protein CcmA [Pasteurella multocida 36950]AHE64704.1 heme ABC exporter ATP-binding protein CcmA [Pasteurella multocida subsp. multocida str. HB03]AIN48353.1 heme ABC expor
MQKTYQLKTEKLACQRGDKILFTALNLTVNSGDFIQIEGHNGIGKTSLLRILVGLAQQLEGNIFWNSELIQKQREEYQYNLLYLGHHSGIKPELTAWENLKFYQHISASEQGEEILWQVLETVGLLGREDIPAAQLSAGQQRRIALARLWLSKAPLWILDEPFTAIDKKGVQVLTALFEQHVQKGGMVIFTSHQDVQSHLLTKVRLENYKFMD